MLILYAHKKDFTKVLLISTHNVFLYDQYSS